LKEYQRQGIGRWLMGHVVRKFLDQGITYMSLYADANNPSCRFFEVLGGKNLVEPDGQINNSWYVWEDLPALAAICPIR
jgi:GNAT superfamily N-acetyltransferase